MSGYFDLFKRFAELLALGAILYLPFAHPGMKLALGHLRRLAIPAIVALFFAAHAFAQFTTVHQYHYPQTREPFPFTRWAMFAGPIFQDMPCVINFDWRGLRSDNSSVTLNPAHLFLTPNAVTLFTKTLSLGQALLSSDPDRKAFATAATDAFALGLLNRYNHLHPDSPIHCVELWQRRVDLLPGSRPPDPFTPDHCQLIHAFAPGAPQ
jgi:hypothetical protein